VRDHHKVILQFGLPSLMANKQMAHIKVMYEFMEKVNCLKQMYTEFNKVIAQKGEHIVETCLETPAGVEETKGEDSMVVDKKEQKAIKKNHFILEILKYRSHVQDILKVIVKISENNEHAYAFKKQEKMAFETICERGGDLTAEYLAIAFGKFLHRKNTIENMDQQYLEALIGLFRCIKPLDIFEAFYRKELSVRLLNK